VKTHRLIIVAPRDGEDDPTTSVTLLDANNRDAAEERMRTLERDNRRQRRAIYRLVAMVCDWKEWACRVVGADASSVVYRERVLRIRARLEKEG
jgi:hypothetical protein